MRRIDMHVHTIASDGSLSAEHMADMANEKKIDFVCVADHDTTEALSEFQRKAHEYGIQTVNAVELTSLYDGLEIHILGYGFSDNKKEDVNKFGNRVITSRDNRDRITVAQLADIYDNIDISEYDSYEFVEELGGFKAINYLKSKGIVKDYIEFSNLRDTLDIPQMDYPSAEETVDFLLGIGAVPVLAHPSYHFRKSVMEIKMLDDFRNMGISAIECLSHYNPEKEQFEYYKNYCRKYDLAISAGSDCHGPYLTREMGIPYADEAMCDILERLGM